MIDDWLKNNWNIHTQKKKNMEDYCQNLEKAKDRPSIGECPGNLEEEASRKAEKDLPRVPDPMENLNCWEQKGKNGNHCSYHLGFHMVMGNIFYPQQAFDSLEGSIRHILLW